MTAVASVARARCTSARRSCRTARRRDWASHAGVRSVFQRWRQCRSLLSMPRLAIRATIPRARHSWRHRGWSWRLSAWSLCGLRRGRPRGPRTAGQASRVAASFQLSCRLAPLSVRPSSVPSSSTTKCRFVPASPRSGALGLPPSGFGDSSGSNGEIAAQRSSGKRGVVIEPQRNDPGLVPSFKLKAGWITASVEAIVVIFGNSEHVPLRSYRPAAVRENR
jgi:hypothetical protein